MAKAPGTKRVHPDLIRQLDEAEENDASVEAVFTLDQDGAGLAEPDRVEQVARRLIARTRRESGAGVDDYNVFRNLASFVVRAKPAFIRSLLDQPEIASAVPNGAPASASRCE
jgi:hypothetical protein